MTGPLYKLGGLCARRSVWVLSTWVLFAVLVAVLANATGSPTSDDTTIPGSDSTRATDLLAKDLPTIQNGSVPIVLETKKGKLTDSSNKSAVESSVKKLQANKDVESLIDPLSPQGAGSLSKDQTIGFISLFLKDGSGDLDEDTANAIYDDADPARDAGIEVSAGGYLGATLSTPSTRLSEIVGIGAAMIVLVFVLGTAMAMVMPITTAIVGVFSGLSVLGVVGAAIVVPSIAPTLALMLGLGVGVDYSLFIVSRHLRQLGDGMDVHESVARAVATSGGAVVFAGGTVVVSLLCLFFGGIPQVQQLGYSAAIGVFVVIVASLTMLPAGLALLGRRIHSLRVRTPAPADPDVTGWGRWAEGIGKRPVISAALGILLLVVLALPVLQISLGAQDNGEMPTNTTIRQSYDTMTKGFGVGSNGPLLIAVKLDPAAKNDQQSLNQFEQQQQQQQEAVDSGQAPPPSQQQQQQAQQQESFLESPASDPRLVKLQDSIGKAGDVQSVSQQATLNKAGTAASFSVVPKSAPSDERTQDLVNHLRDDVIPAAVKGSGLTVYVGGTTAANIDLAHKIGETLPIVIVIIVAISFLLLTLAFRTLVVPALAALSNLLAVAAAYGVLVAVFQKGWGVTLIGLDEAIPIVSFVPLMMFAVLFGLSTDYTVFLLTRISEEFEAHGDHRRAIIEGLGRAARVIVAAAGIMILVFASFIINGNPTVKQFGVGLAVAVAVDAVIVCLILPALMLLVGKAVWWMPKPIERHLPRLGIEGDEYFRERDATAPGS